MDTCTAVIPAVSISQTSLTARVNGTFELRCNIDKAYGSPAGFQWQHTNANGVVQLYDVSSLVPRVTVAQAMNFPTYSMLTIENLSVEDSGQIRCIYYYPLGEGVMTVSSEAWLCVSDIPDTSPMCSRSFTNDNVTLQCISTHICPNDVTLEWRQLSTSDLYIGTLTRNVSHTENVLVLQRRDLVNDEKFTCKFRSELHPGVFLKCTISAYMTPGIPEVSTIIPSTSEQTTETFSQTSIIIIACAIGIDILLFIGCGVVLAYRRKRKRSKSKPHNEDDEASYAEVNITDIEDTASTELEPNETANDESYQRKIINVDDLTEDQRASHVYVNDWRFKQIQK